MENWLWKEMKQLKGEYKGKLTFGQKLADKLANFVGSWGFIVFMVVLLIAWIIMNVLVLIKRWDPYPFILLNLILSCFAAIQEPLILMSQNRAVQRDRLKAERDYLVNRKSEKGIEEILSELRSMKKGLGKRK